MRASFRVLSSVSHRVHVDACEVFFGQVEFRFTSDVGWIMLYRFLERAGTW